MRYGWVPLCSGLGKATYVCVPLSPSNITRYRPTEVISLAGKVIVRLVESKCRLTPGSWQMSPAADCQKTGISSVPNIRNRVCEYFMYRTQFGQRSFHVAAPSSGTRCLHTCAQPPPVVNSSEMGWRLTSSHRPTPSSENFWLREYMTLTLTYLLTLTPLLSVCLSSTTTCHILQCPQSTL